MKQVATFEEFVGVGEHPISGEINATLRNVIHPKIGRESIAYTSRLERIEYGDDGKVIGVETRNTIYRRDTP